MEEIFIPKDTDKGLVISLIREINIILSPIPKDDIEYKVLYSKYRDCINVMRVIEQTEPQNEDDISFIIKTINDIYDKGILSHLTLRDTEFEKGSADKIRHNIRYNPIIKYKDLICNTNAYKITIRKAYNNNLNEEIHYNAKTIEYNPILYISKGGIITGEYIRECIIRKDIIDKHYFTIQSIVNIPASVIKNDNEFYYVVDHREPKLKALKEFYDVPIYIDENAKNIKLNIRKYKKL